MRPDMDTIDRWVTLSANQGIAFVFTACVLLLIIYVTVVLVGLLKKWIPKWFEMSINSHERVCKAIDKLTESVECIHERTHHANSAAGKVLDAAHQHLSDPEVKQRLGIKSDGILKIRQARDELREGDNGRYRHEHDKAG